MTHVADLDVIPVSSALAGRRIDVVVSGSIGAVESVRFIRALRRLGAEVTPWLTAGGSEFVTATALEWAAGRAARTTFSGEHTHVATGDGCLVAPASANVIGTVAHGRTDSPSGALIASYLGRSLPVLIIPNMHDSLAQSPAVARNLGTIQAYGVRLLPTRHEEGKRKFPDPVVLADEAAHALNSWHKGAGAVLVTMGTTQGAIDDVRYVSNYSSGALGSAISEELYRMGFATHVVCGPCPQRPRVATQLTRVTTNSELSKAAGDALNAGCRAAVLAASVLDFVPEAPHKGKIPSAQHKTITLTLKRTEKIIAALGPASGLKVGFKLETGLTLDRARAIARDYATRYQLSMMVINDRAEVDEEHHKAFVFDFQNSPDEALAVTGKLALAQKVAQHIACGLRQP